MSTGDRKAASVALSLPAVRGQHYPLQHLCGSTFCRPWPAAFSGWHRWATKYLCAGECPFGETRYTRRLTNPLPHGVPVQFRQRAPRARFGGPQSHFLALCDLGCCQFGKPFLNTDGGYLSLHARSRSDAGRLVSLLPPPGCPFMEAAKLPAGLRPAGGIGGANR